MYFAEKNNFIAITQKKDSLFKKTVAEKNSNH